MALFIDMSKSSLSSVIVCCSVIVCWLKQRRNCVAMDWFQLDGSYATSKPYYLSKQFYNENRVKYRIIIEWKYENIENNRVNIYRK